MIFRRENLGWLLRVGWLGLGRAGKNFIGHRKMGRFQIKKVVSSSSISCWNPSYKISCRRNLSFNMSGIKVILINRKS